MSIHLICDVDRVAFTYSPHVNLFLAFDRSRLTSYVCRLVYGHRQSVLPFK